MKSLQSLGLLTSLLIFVFFPVFFFFVFFFVCIFVCFIFELLEHCYRKLVKTNSSKFNVVCNEISYNSLFLVTIIKYSDLLTLLNFCVYYCPDNVWKKKSNKRFIDLHVMATWCRKKKRRKKKNAIDLFYNKIQLNE